MKPDIPYTNQPYAKQRKLLEKVKKYLTKKYLFHYTHISSTGSIYIRFGSFDMAKLLTTLIASVTEGSDKPYKYPLAFEKVDILLINKYDLAKYMNFDEEYFMRGAERLNSGLKTFKVSALTGVGFTDAAKELQIFYEKLFG